MKLIVGLGNPGSDYAGTRHNAGFCVVEALARREDWSWEDSPHSGRVARGAFRPSGELAAAPEVALLMPMTFMNRSGRSVRSAVEAFRLTPERDLIVVFDDLDLPEGRLRLRAAGGCGGHRGMESIAAELGTESFARLRFGIGRPPQGQAVVDYVLSPFEDPERLAVCSDRAVDALEVAVTLDLPRAMERFNRATGGEGGSSGSSGPGQNG